MKLVEKTQYKININETLEIIQSLNWNLSEQLCITSRNGDNLKDGAGSINSYHCKEHEFSKINRPFIGSSIDGVLQKLKSEGYSFGRVRILGLQPRSTYSYHMDCEHRIHFALVTNPGSMLIIDEQVFRIPADGHGYLVNTTQMHTAINCDSSPRIHLVINRLIPVIKNETDYIILNKRYSEDDFQKWILQDKPPTAQTREDYYYVENSK